MAPGLEFGVQACVLPEGRGRKALTACWKSVDMPMLSSTFSTGRLSFSHTSCRRDSSTCSARGDRTGSHTWTATPAPFQGDTDPNSCLSLKRPSHRTCNSHASHRSTGTASGDFPDFLTTQRRLNPHLDQGLQDSNCCPAQILPAASEEGWEKYPAERSLTPALTLVLRALHYPAQGVPTSLQPDSDWFDWDRQTVTGNQPTVTFSPRKSYLEVRIWPLTEVMPDAANGHQPHKFQAGALVDDMLHGSRGVCRRKAMLAWKKTGRSVPSSAREMLSAHPVQVLCQASRTNMHMSQRATYCPPHWC